MLSEKMRKMNGNSGDYDRKVVCRSCGLVMSDMEPDTGYGEFWHGWVGNKSTRPCQNDGATFDLSDTKKVAEFVRKRIRRAAKRAGTSV